MGVGGAYAQIKLRPLRPHVTIALIRTEVPPSTYCLVTSPWRCAVACQCVTNKPWQAALIEEATSVTKPRKVSCSRRHTLVRVSTTRLSPMDPLSITAGVIAIIHLVNKTLSICMKIRKTFKESPNGLTRIIEETRCLRNIFEALQSALDDTPSIQNQASGSATHEGIWNSLRDVLAPCRVLLEDLNQKLVGAPTQAVSKPETTAKRLVAAFRWQLKEPQVRHFLERLERCKSHLTVALSAHQS